ncbi:GAF and ANTAR domain-containing protein [Arthrobacter burdickii]|uniref:GAF and ANTAR domain-containing protein n=1 Tax=Arthrobacter burdickii TaxID=3035920 RepID=A0ABT8JXK5_9MICC|nr:GAF and ANTAR domain-containing protein [Arthrobacter burdickii]MDN4609908.1 GAF and ANTAR domain-containing protein [Arthrobacter burdickii]
MNAEQQNAAAVAELQDLMLTNENVDQFLEDLAGLSARILGESVEVQCGVTYRHRSLATTVACSSDEARILDEIQYGFGDGPCLHAISTGSTVIVDDVRTDGRWPEYFEAVAGHEYFAMMGVPLVLGPEGGAALNFYGASPSTFTSSAQALAEGFATQAAKALQMVLRVSQHANTSSNLRAAMESRTTIDIAIGIIMGQNRCTQAEAYTMLSRASNAQNVKVREIAQRIVSGITTAPAETHFSN